MADRWMLLPNKLMFILSQVFEDLKEYMNSLEKLKGLNPSVIYPGHGPVVKDCGKIIQGYIDHRLQREQQVYIYIIIVQTMSRNGVRHFGTNTKVLCVKSKWSLASNKY